ncbi:MAG: vitamin B12 dependent-methionine synthase activation domain-containing protein, partial [Gemmatimonadota bacterium]|nr:vitamin B12 dependent-methionine synthase activation domain-containing protein [Gemmatimonadota bacterium]
VPYMEAEREAGARTATAKGKVLLATVKGDVHDIGKNIFGVVLRCNGYEVVDLGVMVPADRILDRAEEEDVDVVGLSGLITPSLDQMMGVAREMERRQLDLPLLIGGATTSRTHTAVKIDETYSAPVVHVTDASRAVGVVGRLLGSAEKRRAFAAEISAEYDRVRAHHADRMAGRAPMAIEEARANRWTPRDPARSAPTPRRPGVHLLNPYPLRPLLDYIDWTPFLHTWEIRGRYPSILEDEEKGEAARRLLADAREMLEEIVDGELLRARASLGLFPSEARGDDLLLRDPESGGLLASVPHLRQQTERTGRPNLCLSDFVAQADEADGASDWSGAFAVTAGIGLEELVARYEGAGDDYRSLLAKSLADRLAEAAAERLHQQVRRDFWGYAPDEELTNEELIAEEYDGIRPAPGYPACPDHSQKRILLDILGGEEATGIRLTESYAMWPAAAVSGWYFGHPEAEYFGLGRIGRDQVADYARRCGIDAAEAERRLSPNLAYEPDSSVEGAA